MKEREAYTYLVYLDSRHSKVANVVYILKWQIGCKRVKGLKLKSQDFKHCTKRNFTQIVNNKKI